MRVNLRHEFIKVRQGITILCLLFMAFFPAVTYAQNRVRDIFILHNLSDEKLRSNEYYWSRQSFVSIENIIGDNYSLTICKSDTISSPYESWIGAMRFVYVPTDDFNYIERIYRDCFLKANNHLPTGEPYYPFGVYIHAYPYFMQIAFGEKLIMQLLFNSLIEGITDDTCLSTDTKKLVIPLIRSQFAHIDIKQ